MINLNITITDAQEAALDALNQSSNRGGIVPPLDVFAVSYISAYLDEFVAADKGRAIEDFRRDVLDKFDNLDAQKLAAIAAIVDTK